MYPLSHHLRAGAPSSRSCLQSNAMVTRAVMSVSPVDFAKMVRCRLGSKHGVGFLNVMDTVQK